MTGDGEALELAREHVKAVRDFWYHAMVYVLVSAILVALDLRTTGEGSFLGLDWAHWVIITWGFGVAGHAVSVVFGEHRARMHAARYPDRRVE